MNIDNELSFIQFGVLSPEETLALSVVEVNNPGKDGAGTVFDPAMGPITEVNCKTCLLPADECAGHFGHINLVFPVVNPLFGTKLASILNTTCLKCGTVIKSQPMSRKTKCAAKCALESIEKGIYTFDSGHLYHTTHCGKSLVNLARLKDDLLRSKSSSLKHATNFIITVLPVLPHLNRPSLYQGSSAAEDDITRLYIEIVKNNVRASAVRDSDSKYETYVDKIVQSVNTIFDNNKGSVRHPSSGRNIVSMVDRMAGKMGYFRNHCMGKRSDYTARAVATAAPENWCDEVSLPSSIMNILTVPVTCTKDNLEEMQALCDSGRVDFVSRMIDGSVAEFAVSRFMNVKQTKLDRGQVIHREGCLPINVRTGREELLPGDVLVDSKGNPVSYKLARKRRFMLKAGDIAARFLQDGDVVLVNRQPTLHSGNFIGMHAKRTEDKTIKIPLSATTRLNADFDGDELNIHVVQSDKARKEIMDNAHVKKTILSPASGKPMLNLVQDSILALYLMSKSIAPVKKMFINEADAQRVYEYRVRAGMHDEHRGYDTYGLISSCLDPRLCFTADSAVVRDGVWIEGLFTKSISNKLIRRVFEKLGEEAACAMVSKFQIRSVGWLTHRGFTIDGGDFAACESGSVEEIVKSMAENGEDGRTIRDLVHGMVLSKAPNIYDCVQSGAKGTTLNIGQIKGCLGQQQQNCGFIPNYLSGGRVLSHDKEPKTAAAKLVHSGFVASSYSKGLTLREFMVHSLPSRDSIVSTSTGTANSGYMQHKLVKTAEDVLLRDGQVIYNSSSPRTISLRYTPKIEK